MRVAEFLAARLDEDEAALGSGPKWVLGEDPRSAHVFDQQGNYVAVCMPHMIVDHSERNAEHIARYNPMRMQADIAAKRGVLEYWGVFDGLRQDDSAEDGKINTAIWSRLTDVLATLAEAYSNHPDYNPAWPDDPRPDLMEK